MKLGNLIPEGNKEVVNEMIDPETLQTIGTTIKSLLLLGGFEVLTHDGEHGIIGHAINDLKDFATKVTKIRPILNKLDKDPEVQDFLMKNVHDISDPRFYDKIEKNFEKIISSKLDKKDAEYMRDLQINDLPSYKSDKLRKGVEDKNQQWRSDSAAAYNAKKAEKLKKIAGGLDLDTTKIKNPRTGNDISLRSALGYGKTHPVFQSAMAKVKQSKSKGGNPPSSKSNIF
jgi:hypothetical protein